MPTDIASLLLAVTLNLVTMAAALPVVMGQVNGSILHRRGQSRGAGRSTSAPGVRVAAESLEQRASDQAEAA